MSNRARKSFVRAYSYKTAANTGKLEKLLLLAREYRKTAGKVASLQWQLFFSVGAFNVFEQTNLKALETRLSERYKQTIQAQVVGQLKSYVSNRANDYKRLVQKSYLNPDIKRTLLFIGNRQLWFANEITFCHKPVAFNTLKLARRIFKQTLSKNRKPSFAKCQLNLDAKVAEVSLQKVEGKQLFPYWVKISTLQKGKPVYFPLRENPYGSKSRGELLKFVQLNFTKNKNLSVALLKKAESFASAYEPCAESIGLDFGLDVLFSTDKGDLLGKHFYDVVKKYDRLISKLTADRQKQKLKVTSPRYRALVTKLRGYIKSEINYCLNKVVDLYQPKRIVLERLNFRNPTLSRRLNRILTNCGRSVVQSKLQDLEDRFGIEIEEVNPAYTSQICATCGYVSKNNRPERSKFRCGLCGRSAHADVNSAKNIRRRSSFPLEADIYVSRKAVLSAVVSRHIHALENEIRPLRSRAISLAKRNSYYRGKFSELESLHELPW